MSKPPIIIIGMHRSGTTLLSRLIEGMGVFMGVKKDIYDEAIYFMEINKWILRQLNSQWDKPPVNIKIECETYKKIVSYINEMMDSYQRIKYMGIKNYLRYKSIKDIDFPWGWKDPRNTFTVKFWLDIFPDAKVLHIYRNPIDVALSLKIREEKLIRAKHNRNILKKAILPKDIYIAEHLLDIRGGILLWEQYLNKILEIDRVMEGKIFHIKYEELLSNTHVEIKKIVKYLNLSTTDDHIDRLCREIRKDRCYKFLNNSNLKDIYEEIKHKPLMKIWGYDNLKFNC